MPATNALRVARTTLTQRAQLASLLVLGCVSLVWAADKVAALSDDFLEYLGSLEGDDDSWMDFTVETTAAAKPVTAPETITKAAASSSSAASVNAKATTGKVQP